MRRQPAAFENRGRRRRHGEDNIGRGGFVNGYCAAARFCSEFFGIGASAAPDADVLERGTNHLQCLNVGARLPTAAENSQAAHLGRAESIERDGGDGGGAHLGDEAAVHYSEGLAGGAAQQLDDRHVRVQAEFVVAGKKRDCLYSHHVAGYNRHHGEPAVVVVVGIAGAKDGACRLFDETGGVVDESLANGGDEGLVGEDGADFLLGDVHGSWSSVSV